ncbi:MAG: ATP synthase F1 subunit gamma [bacterium]
MAGLKQIKSKIRSVEKTQTVTKAMEAVSAAKMRKAQQTALGGRAYARAAVSILSRMSGSASLKNHALVAARPIVQKVLWIVITSDKGLAGALNSAVLRSTYSEMLASGIAKEDVRVVAVGKKALDFFTTRGFVIEAYHPNNDKVTSELVDELVREATFRFSAGAVDVVMLSYQNFISTFEQHATVRQIFPLHLEQLLQTVADIAPKKGTLADVDARGRDAARVPAYTVEPSEEEVLLVILPKLASIFVYHALLESQASEHSARMVAMKSASDKAEEMEHLLRLKFNKARQAAITREVSEITGGMEAMAA